MLPKRYKSEWRHFAGVMGIIWVLFFFLSPGVPLDRLLKGQLILLVTIVVVLILIAKCEYILITPDKKMKNVYMFLFFQRETFYIRDITSIERVPLYRGLAWAYGYQLFVNFIKEDGTPDYTRINLNLYLPHTIQDLLKTLLEINPKIQLDKEVQKMLEQSKDKKAA